MSAHRCGSWDGRLTEVAQCSDGAAVRCRRSCLLQLIQLRRDFPPAPHPGLVIGERQCRTLSATWANTPSPRVRDTVRLRPIFAGMASVSHRRCIGGRSGDYPCRPKTIVRLEQSSRVHLLATVDQTRVTETSASTAIPRPPYVTLPRKCPMPRPVQCRTPCPANKTVP